MTHEIIVSFSTTHANDNPRVEVPIQLGPPTLKGRKFHRESSKPVDWESTGKSHSVRVLSSSAVLGGKEEDDGDETDSVRVRKHKKVHEPTYDNLLKEMAEYINDLGTCF